MPPSLKYPESGGVNFKMLNTNPHFYYRFRLLQKFDLKRGRSILMYMSLDIFFINIERIFFIFKTMALHPQILLNIRILFEGLHFSLLLIFFILLLCFRDAKFVSYKNKIILKCSKPLILFTLIDEYDFVI